MRKKTEERKQAIELRRKGFSYSEILLTIPVAKSTLSLWLRNVKLDPKAKSRLKERTKLGQPFGARAQRRIRLEKTERIVTKAKEQIRNLSKKDLFKIGAVLYWAEGTKQKNHSPSQRVTFNNSDPAMIKIYLKWLFECLNVNNNSLDFEIYSHDNIKERENEIIAYWVEITGFPRSKFGKIYYKKDKKKKYRRNQGKNYFGLLRVCVKRSTDLNRQISGWIEGICQQCGVV